MATRIEPSDVSLDEAAERALKSMGLTYEEHLDVLIHDCENGHLDCARRQGGACFGEAIARAAGRIAAETNAAAEAADKETTVTEHNPFTCLDIACAPCHGLDEPRPNIRVEMDHDDGTSGEGDRVEVHANGIVIDIIVRDDGTVAIEMTSEDRAQQAVVGNAFIDAYRFAHPSMTLRLADRTAR